MKRKTFGGAILKINIMILVCIAVLSAATVMAGSLWMLPVWLVTLTALGLVYYHKIYIPVKNMDRTMELLSQVNPDIHMTYFSDSGQMLDDLSALIGQMHTAMEKEHQAQLLNHELMYEQLQSQINPHFLYNTLESIRGQAVIDDNYKIADMTEALARYFRYTISRKEEQVTIRDELENIKNYVYIQQYRFEDRFDFKICCHDESGLCMKSVIPKMTLQPLVENAIFYGMENKIEKGHITIHVEATRDTVTLIVADDGAGMDAHTLAKLNDKIAGTGQAEAEKAGKGNGVALRNINQRLKLLFGPEYGLYVSSTQSLGTEVEVRLPLVVDKTENE